MMKKTKEIYSQPTTKLLVVRVEGNLLTVSNPTQVNGTRGGYTTFDLDPDDE